MSSDPELADFLKKAARQARGESVSSEFPEAKTLSYMNDEDPAHAHLRAKTRDLEADTELKKTFATSFIRVLKIQLILMNIIFVFIGFKWLEFGDLVVNLFMTGTLAEVFGIVMVMTRYLFSKHD
ncbi:hypothetical protein R5S71_003810 [Salmonella enterica]|nr:hypothetical protein [Salmonella enterica subsp. enterica serovar Javiana]EAQ9998720.1 hypothetical protein [Salmonella enterica]OIN22842.1 hypothetical protein AO411_2016600 [Salmonella enterica subsp. enterica serovar Sarajane]HBJ6194584.1 hypothetical protein [Salmonella enterica subsp. enterica serovar Saintpaul]EIN7571548.1 hypothetical protein [Salmonella enterica]